MTPIRGLSLVFLGGATSVDGGGNVAADTNRAGPDPLTADVGARDVDALDAAVPEARVVQPM
jgi:hypothetical protein